MWQLISIFSLLLLLTFCHGSNITNPATVCPPINLGYSKVLCYYEGRKDANDIYLCGCSHLIYTGNLQASNLNDIAKKLLKKQPSMKFVLRITGKEQNLKKLISKPHFHGVEVYRTYTELNKNKVSTLIQNVRNTIGSRSILLVSLPVAPELIAKYYDLKKIQKFVDLFALETQFLNDIHRFTFHPSRLSGLWDMLNVDSVVDLVIGLGTKPEKLVILSPTLSYIFTLSNKTLSTPGSPTIGFPGTLNQEELCTLMSDGAWTLERDQDLSAPYAFQDDKWVAFEDASSLDVKSKYTRIRGLAGHGLIHIDDDPHTKCNSRLVEYIVRSLSTHLRAPRQAVLGSLSHEILSVPNAQFWSSSIQLSPYRIARIVDADGVLHAIRDDTRTEFECQRQGYFVHPRSCNRFYRCVKFDQQSNEFTVFEFDCPTGLEFDVRYEVCVWPGSIDKGQACPGTSEIAPVPNTRFICPKKQGYYADPENCRWFFACLHHGREIPTAYEFRCPFGLGFDEKRRICGWPWLIPACGDVGKYESTLYDHGHTHQGIIINGPPSFIGNTADSINVAGYKSIISGAKLDNLIGVQDLSQVTGTSFQQGYIPGNNQQVLIDGNGQAKGYKVYMTANGQKHISSQSGGQKENGIRFLNQGTKNVYDYGQIQVTPGTEHNIQFDVQNGPTFDPNRVVYVGGRAFQNNIDPQQNSDGQYDLREVFPNGSPSGGQKENGIRFLNQGTKNVYDYGQIQVNPGTEHNIQFNVQNAQTFDPNRVGHVGGGAFQNNINPQQNSNGQVQYAVLPDGNLNGRQRENGIRFQNQGVYNYGQIQFTPGTEHNIQFNVQNAQTFDPNRVGHVGGGAFQNNINPQQNSNGQVQYAVLPDGNLNGRQRENGIRFQNQGVYNYGQIQFTPGTEHNIQFNAQKAGHTFDPNRMVHEGNVAFQNNINPQQNSNGQVRYEIHPDGSPGRVIGGQNTNIINNVGGEFGTKYVVESTKGVVTPVPTSTSQESQYQLPQQQFGNQYTDQDSVHGGNLYFGHQLPSLSNLDIQKYYYEPGKINYTLLDSDLRADGKYSTEMVNLILHNIKQSQLDTGGNTINQPSGLLNNIPTESYSQRKIFKENTPTPIILADKGDKTFDNIQTISQIYPREPVTPILSDQRGVTTEYLLTTPRNPKLIGTDDEHLISSTGFLPTNIPIFSSTSSYFSPTENSSPNSNDLNPNFIRTSPSLSTTERVPPILYDSTPVFSSTQSPFSPNERESPIPYDPKRSQTEDIVPITPRPQYIIHNDNPTGVPRQEIETSIKQNPKYNTDAHTKQIDKGFLAPANQVQSHNINHQKYAPEHEVFDKVGVLKYTYSGALQNNDAHSHKQPSIEAAQQNVQFVYSHQPDTETNGKIPQFNIPSNGNYPQIFNGSYLNPEQQGQTFTQTTHPINDELKLDFSKYQHSRPDTIPSNVFYDQNNKFYNEFENKENLETNIPIDKSIHYIGQGQGGQKFISYSVKHESLPQFSGQGIPYTDTNSNILSERPTNIASNVPSDINHLQGNQAGSKLTILTLMDNKGDGHYYGPNNGTLREISNANDLNKINGGIILGTEGNANNFNIKNLKTVHSSVPESVIDHISFDGRIQLATLKNKTTVAIVTKLNDYVPLIINKLQAQSQCSRCCIQNKIQLRKASEPQGNIENNENENIDSSESQEYDEIEEIQTINKPKITVMSSVSPIIVEDFNNKSDSTKKIIQPKARAQVKNDNLSGMECKREGLFRNPKNCNKFYSCSWETKKQQYKLHEFNCPIKLSFDHKMKACNWPSQGPACQSDILLPNI